MASNGQDPNQARAEQTNAQRQRLRWQCRRGMLELDYLLLQFLEMGYNGLASHEKTTFDNLLAKTDQDLSHWLFVTGGPPEFSHVIKKIRATAQA